MTTNKMDTRFWGPSGWRLLHLITFSYDPIQKESIREFFTMLPYVLPCKFCRASLSEYYEKDPLEPALKSKALLSKWLWRIHNMVNDKLRSQGLNTAENPSFASIQKIYEERIAKGCVRTEFEGWDFLFSIVDNHPFTRSSMHSTPLSDSVADTPDLRNRYNVMSPDERMEYYTQFWKSVGESLPFEEWRMAWKNCDLDFSNLRSRKLWIKELWRIRCCLEDKLELVNCEEFNSLCKRLSSHRSGCSRKKRARTCRKTTRKH